MLAAILLSLALQSGQVAPPANTLPLPNDIYNRWPGTEPSPSRWTLRSPMGWAPFVVAAKYQQGEIAVRWATTPPQGSARGTFYYVAMRQTPERLEQADSRECRFGPVVEHLRTLPLPEIIVPGSRPVQDLVGPPLLHHGGNVIMIMGGRQPDGQRAELTLSAQEGPIREWVDDLFAATDACWKPMTSPDGVSRTP